MKRAVFIICLLWCVIWCVSALGETLYVRPAGGAYGSEDGSTYADAWDGIENVEWGVDAGDVGPGDTLYVCGTHIRTHSDFPLNLDGSDYRIYPVSGTEGNPVTIRGD